MAAAPLSRPVRFESLLQIHGLMKPGDNGKLNTLFKKLFMNESSVSLSIQMLANSLNGCEEERLIRGHE